MDWAQVAVNAVAAGTGAGIGSIFGSLLGWLFSKKASILVQSLTVAGAVLGYSVLPPLIEPVIGPPIREVLGPPWELAEVSEELRRHEFFAVMFERNPELEDEFLRTITAAYQSGGADAVYPAGFTWGSDNVAVLFEEYAPYARDEDLRAWLEEMASVLNTLLDGDPFVCYDFMYGAQMGHPLDQDSLPEELQAELIRFLDEVMTPMIRHADDTVEYVTTDDDQAAFLALAVELVSDLGVDRVKFVQSVRPESEIDARAVCRASAGLFANIAEHPRAPQIARIMLSQ